MVSAVSRNGSCKIDSFNDSAQMGDGLGPSSNGSGVEIRSDEDQLEPLSAADSVDKSIIIDSSDTSTTTTEWPGDNHEIFSKESLPLESKIVWREGLVQRWEGLRNGEIDALLLLSSCADRDQTFPRATRSHRLGGKPELCPSSPGSDSSTSSNLSSFKPMLPGYSLRMRNKSFIPSNQHSEATSDHALKSHKVAATPAVANGNPFQQICSQACSRSVSGCLDIKHVNNCGFLKPEQKENLHNMVCCDSSVQHKLSPLKIPPSCSDPRRNSLCRRDDSYYAYSNDYEGRRYAILQNCYHCDSHAKLLSSKLMASCAGTDQPIEAQISEYPKHGAPLTKGVIVRPSVATHTAVENGTHFTFNYRSTSEPTKSCRVPPIQEQLLSQRSSNCITNGLDHYNTRKSASRSSQKASVDEVLELQGVRDVHVVETPHQMEAAHVLSLFPSSSPVESPTELRTADLIGIPKPNAGFSDSESMRMEHESKKCSRDISNDNPRGSVRMSSTIHHRCKADLPGWQAEHKPQISIPTTTDSTKQFTSKLDETAISEKFCRCQQHSQAVENKAERDSAITQNCDSSYMHFIAATASAGLLVVGACVIGYVCHRRFRRFRG
ncbi:hypothetical protein O6H91_18G031800 [Diphasiastrum complanatum]|nr:hypothetical protein O6H91_18G031800 [Diphasiastrum complanatum]